MRPVLFVVREPRRLCAALVFTSLATGLATLGDPAPASAAAGTVATVRTPGIPLKVRTGPATRHRVVGQLPNGSRVAVACRTRGQSIRGTVTTTSAWARLSRGGYASAAYLAGAHRAPWCSARPAAAATVRTPGIPLKVRTGPATRYRVVGQLPNGGRVAVACRATGQTIRGTVTTTATWARLTRGGYASAAYLRMPRGVAGCRTAAPAPSPSEFLRRAVAAARHSDQRYGIPASVTIAQAMLESGWGRSGLATEGNNYFGIKCIGGTGPIATGCKRYRTFECERRRCFSTYAWFRTYDSVRDSFADHARLLTRADRYATAMRHRSNPNRFAIEVHRAGYATDPRYARKLIRLMRMYDLYRFD